MTKVLDYNELAKAKVQEKRNIVISEVKDGGFTIAQQLEVEEGNRITNVFLKNAFHIDEEQGLYNLRDALNVAIAKLEAKKNSKNIEWDED